MKYSVRDVKAVNDIIQRSHTDPEFRIKLFKNASTILNEFNVSENVKSLILNYFDEIKN